MSHGRSMGRGATPDRYACDMHTIPFTRSAAWVTIGEGLTIGARYWAATWERWVLAAVAVALTDGLATWLLGSTLLDQATMTQLMLPGAEGIDPSALPGLLAGPIAVAMVSLVADWFLYANAVAGLRGREVTLGWVLGAGLRTLLVLAGVAFLLSGAFAVLVVLGPLGLLAMAGALPVIVYLVFRLQFWVVGVFDGLGVTAAARSSLEITRRAVLRVVGWWLALVGLSLVIAAFSAATSILFTALPVVPAVVGSLLSTSFQAFSVIVVAILYESQRLRWMGLAAAPYGSHPPRAQPPVGWGQPAPHTPSAPSDPAEPPDPDAPPQPPPPPPPAVGPRNSP